MKSPKWVKLKRKMREVKDEGIAAEEMMKRLVNEAMNSSQAFDE